MIRLPPAVLAAILFFLVYGSGLVADDKIIDTKKFSIQEATILKFDKEEERHFQAENTPDYKLTFVVFPKDSGEPINLYAYPDSISVEVRTDGQGVTTLSADLEKSVGEYNNAIRYKCKSVKILVPVQEDAELWKKYVAGIYKFLSFENFISYTPNEYYSHWIFKLNEYGSANVIVPVDNIELVLKEKPISGRAEKLQLVVDNSQDGITTILAKSAKIFCYDQVKYDQLKKDLEETKKKRDAIKQPKRVVPDKQ